MSTFITVKQYAKLTDRKVRTIQYHITKHDCLPYVVSIVKFSGFTMLEVNDEFIEKRMPISPKR